MWLYKLTGQASYVTKAQAVWSPGSTSWSINWDDVSYGAAILLWDATGQSQYSSNILTNGMAFYLIS